MLKINSVRRKNFTGTTIRNRLLFSKFKGVSDVFLGQLIPFYSLPRIADLKNTKAVILSSSGTTGLPKCVLISHAMILSGFANTSVATDGLFKYVAVFPHGGASTFEIHVCILLYSPRIITAQPVTVDLVLEVLQKHDVGLTVLFPFNVAAMAKRIMIEKYDLSKLKKIATGGSTLSEATRINLTKILPNVEIEFSYGMTEFGMIASSNANSKLSSSGFLLPDLSAKVGNRIRKAHTTSTII